MGDRVVATNEVGLLGMTKYLSEWSGSDYVVGRDGWKWW